MVSCSITEMQSLTSIRNPIYNLAPFTKLAIWVIFLNQTLTVQISELTGHFDLANIKGQLIRSLGK